MEKAIERMRQMVDEQTEFISQLESGEITLPADQPIRSTESLIRTYRFWASSLSMAAYLLENDYRTK